MTKRVTPPDEEGHGERLEFVRVAEQQGYPQIVEMLMQKWLDWHDNLYSSSVNSTHVRMENPAWEHDQIG